MDCMRHSVVVIIIVGVFTGCGADATPSADLAVIAEDLSTQAPTDLAPTDLAAPDCGPPPPAYDLAWSACAGTALAGTCVERFFEPFVSCFHPAGHCGSFGTNSMFTASWQNGARIHASFFGGNPPPWPSTYYFGNNVCLRAYGSSSVVQYCPPDDSSCGPVQDGGMNEPTPTGGRYDQQTGIFTCPDGTQVDVGPKLGDCAVLNELLAAGSDLCDNVGTAQCPSM
jgi:hypothetical protein